MFNEFWHLVGGDHAQFWPASASAFSHSLNGLSLFLLVMSGVFATAVFGALITFAIKYRRRPGNEIARDVPTSRWIETAWTVIPFAITLIAFYVGCRQFIDVSSPPKGAESLYVVGKQWMWKIEHENGLSEINEIHIPVGRDVDLLMISQDVIHSLFIPDFRMKFDVLPGRYTRAWFHADKIGSYALMCTQYCGTDHSEMRGAVTVLSELDYQKWVTESQKKIRLSAVPPDLGPARGARLYATHGCNSCHGQVDATENTVLVASIGPSLVGVYGSVISLMNHAPVVADESYLRESILNPGAKIVAGFQNVMPTYAGQFKEDEILDLIAYLRSLRGRNPNVTKGYSANDHVSQ